MTELEFMVEAASKERASLDAKAAWEADPTDENRAAFTAAKNAHREFKSFWRGIREYMQAAGGDAGAAAPDALGMGVEG